MAMDIRIHSARTVEETLSLTTFEINSLRIKFRDRFWFSIVTESSQLTKEVMKEEHNFFELSGFSVRDNAKEFDGLDEVARALRSALGHNEAIVTYGDVENLFPKEDYA